MFCGIGRDKSNENCKKPPKIYKHPGPLTSPLTVQKDDKKSTDYKRASISPITVPLKRSESDKIYDKAVKKLDVKSKSSKLADELIRYNRIKQFMFKPNMVLSFTDLKYNLNNDEIILLQSLLSNDYFDDLVPETKNKYISFNSYDTVEPNITQKYDNTYIASLNKITNSQLK